MYPPLKFFMEGEKMQLVFKINHNTFKAASLFSLVFVDRWDLLAIGNTTKKEDTCKGKYEAIELKCFIL